MVIFSIDSFSSSCWETLPRYSRRSWRNTAASYFSKITIQLYTFRWTHEDRFDNAHARIEIFSFIWNNRCNVLSKCLIEIIRRGNKYVLINLQTRKMPLYPILCSQSLSSLVQQLPPLSLDDSDLTVLGILGISSTEPRFPCHINEISDNFDWRWNRLYHTVGTERWHSELSYLPRIVNERRWGSERCWQERWEKVHWLVHIWP